jgi:hypothetical protein
VYNQVRQFLVLVDAAYESRRRLILDAEVDRNGLFVGFDADLTTNDGDEEITVREDGASGTSSTTTTMKASRTFGGSGGGNGDTTVVGEGGSLSSLSTTFFHTGDGGGGRVEWSAT